MSDHPSAEPAKSKGPRWLPMAYYYLAALIGLVTFMFALTSALQGFRQFLLPESSDEVIFAGERVLTPEEQGKNNISPAEFERQQEEARKEAIEEAETIGLGRTIDGILGALVAFPVFAWHLRRVRKKEPEWLGTAPDTKGNKPPSS